MKDFFVSYTSADQQWATWIAATLEKASYTTVVQAWDFRPGENFILLMQQAASECRRTIAVMSVHYFSSMFTQVEWAAAFVQDPTGKNRKLIPVRIDRVPPPGLLQSVIFCDLVEVDEATAQARLLEAVREENTRRQSGPATFPGNAATFPHVAPVEQRVPLTEANPDVATVRDLLDLLDTTWTTFVAQARIRNELVERIKERLNPSDQLQYERFFQRYYSRMNEEERAIHGTIRAYTANVLSGYNQSILDLLKHHPELVRKIDLLPELRQHLEVWLAKFKGVFEREPAMCLVYVGVEEKVPFPKGVENKLRAFLESQRTKSVSPGSV